MSVTLDDIMVNARQRADMPTTAFIGDAELKNLINQSYNALYDMCLQSMGVEAFLDGYAFATVAGQTAYALPTDFSKFVGLDMQYGSTWHSLARFSHADRNKYRNATEFFVDGKPRIRYNVKRTTVDLLPTPESAQNCWLHYIPEVTPLSNTSDKIDDAIPDSFTEFIIVDVAARMLIKEESDPSALLQEKQMIMQRIMGAGAREFDQPEASQDTDNTLFNLRIQARYKTDMIGDETVSDTEIDHYINQSYGVLQDLLVTAYGNHYFLDAYQFNTSSGQKDYDLPTDFYKLGGVDITSGGQVYSLSRYNFQERNWHENDDITTKLGSPYFHYDLMQRSIRLLPEPTEVLPVTLWYTKRLSSLSADSDAMSSIIIKDWSEMLLVDVAIKMLNKKLINASAAQAQQIGAAMANLQAQLGAQKGRLKEMAEIRDWGQPARVIDAKGIRMRNIWSRW